MNRSAATARAPAPSIAQWTHRNTSFQKRFQALSCVAINNRARAREPKKRGVKKRHTQGFTNGTRRRDASRNPRKDRSAKSACAVFRPNSLRALRAGELAARLRHDPEVSP